MQNYQIISRHSDINHLISGLHSEEFLAVGIMDTGTRENLEESLRWYTNNYNHNIHVITQSERINQDNMNSMFPDVTFIVFDQAPSLSERINALANTCGTTYFFVTRSDVDLVDFNWQGIEKTMQSEPRPVVVTPLIFNKGKELIPSVRAPHMHEKDIEPMSFIPGRGIDANLYPFLGLGLYNRAIFQRIRGYDDEIENAYWQALDFGTRSWLYGYPIYSSCDLAVIFFGKQFLIEDRSENKTVSRYYTKALSVRMVRGRIIVKKGYKTDKRFMIDQVKPRAGLYKTDFATLCENWIIPM
ncbi:MAG: hypothetical protein K5634_00470 [Sphaerochaetaceae bacterium]|nr:hypothetical protein [Sphaerochaetaceae bacterium]